jgi:hypothetical protein
MLTFMQTNADKINFYFDKNIWSDVTKMTEEELSSFKTLIKPLKEQSRIGIYYSPIGVLELIKGLSLETHYEMCQKEVRVASVISDKHILEYPWDHVRRVAYSLLQRPFKEFDRLFLNLCRKISISPYNQIEPIIAPTGEMLRKWEKEWSDSLNTIRLGFRSLDQKGVKEFKEDAWLRRRKEKYWPYLCQQFSLPEEFKKLPLDETITKFHSLRYSLDYRISHENKLLFDNKKARPSDYLDWIQIVYLNIMDYLVTNDSQLTTILNECKNSELNKVTMRFSEFLDCIKGQLPQKHAPNSTLETWFDAQ